ncbi:Peptidyl-prolyl cis-trans isomerase (rotamase)-cyclophilin family [Paenibacillus sp. UNCCL117]|uniref:peptidylprolyl isomerase n=1 Tax=unclassified Paenibacillus TaxID=185978 RepID=UPI00088C1E0D|nr:MULTISPECIES: peptidylprolyl isomerase [unclassified Paenibacillus]SDC45815.1 Peptidyl-prolyl cis-trans isomerase (rotamase)-cyclophilin family [Paenibacillus sp. cl123]SFW12422.1 Peptidyl-prolyl cis-trans isomerase (rotamase)-cyclophilin family [Paenibacillus sp. UNCCL117]
MSIQMTRTTIGIALSSLLLAGMMLSGCGTKPAPADQGAGGSSGAPAQGGQTEQAKPKSWSSPPAMTIDTAKTYKAAVTTSQGTFTIELYPKEAPKTVNNFVFLAREGFYNDVVFHRIIQSFMIQTGDPKGNGTGGPGYKFEDELKTTRKYEPGIVAMANSGANTNGSQFFICTGEDSKNLNRTPNYTIFGKVIEGMDTIQKIAATPVEAGGEQVPSKPTQKVVIQSIAITEK